MEEVFETLEPRRCLAILAGMLAVFDVRCMGDVMMLPS